MQPDINNKDSLTVEFNPYRELVTDISAREFELYCYEGIKALAEKENLKNFIIRHDYKPTPYDGKRQIDIWCEYTALGSKQIIICECKKTQRKIEIGVVEKLLTRLNSLGAQRGYIFATAGFQSGSIQCAKEHRIVLIQVLEKKVRFITNSTQKVDEKIMQFRQKYFDKLPDYFLVKMDDGNGIPFEQIYPTKSMDRAIWDEIIKNLTKD